MTSSSLDREMIKVTTIHSVIVLVMVTYEQLLKSVLQSLNRDRDYDNALARSLPLAPEPINDTQRLEWYTKHARVAPPAQPYRRGIHARHPPGSIYERLDIALFDKFVDENGTLFDPDRELLTIAAKAYYHALRNGSSTSVMYADLEKNGPASFDDRAFVTNCMNSILNAWYDQCFNVWEGKEQTFDHKELQRQISIYRVIFRIGATVENKEELTPMLRLLGVPWA